MKQLVIVGALSLLTSCGLLLGLDDFKDSPEPSVDQSSSIGGMNATGSNSGGEGTAGGGDCSSGGCAQSCTKMADTPRYDGPLCGPEVLPCKVLADETIPDAPAISGEVALALDQHCEPRMLTHDNVGTNRVWYLTRNAKEVWSVLPTPIKTSHPGLIVLDDGSLVAVGDQYSWTKNSLMNDWVRDHDFGDGHRTYTEGFERDVSGSLHLGVFDSVTKKLSHAVLRSDDTSWNISFLDDDFASDLNFALSPTGTLHVAYRSSDDSIIWTDSSGAREVASRGYASLIKLAVSSADDANPSGRPYVLFNYGWADSAIDNISVAFRSEEASWAVVPVDRGDPDSKFCIGIAARGTSCDSAFDRFDPLGVVVSENGDVRFVYTKSHIIATYMALGCNPPESPQCAFVISEAEVDTDLLVGWIGGNGQFEFDRIIGDVPSVGGVELDPIGRIHIGFGTRYLQIGL